MKEWFEEYAFQSKAFLAVANLLSLTLLVAVAANLQIAREIVGFIYLTVVPGFILVRLLRIDELGLAETVLFSVGLSVGFLMILGLLVNTLYPLTGMPEPLSSTVLLITIVIVVGLLSLADFLTSRKKIQKEEPKRNTTKPSHDRKKTILRILPFTFLPILAVVGTTMVNVYGNNLTLLLMFFLTTILIALASLSSKFNCGSIHAIVLIAVALTLLLHQSLISSYIYGGDSHMEYHVFRITQSSSQWNQNVGSTDLGYNWLNAMLSVTILPTIYSNILDIDGTWFFKIVAPIIFSFISLALYLMYKKNFSSNIAFISVLFLVVNSVFYTETLGNSRQMFAELFFVMIFLVLFDKRITGNRTLILVAIFTASMVFSHYSMSYLFLFFSIGTILLGYMQKRQSAILTPRVVVTFSTIMFGWYIYTSNSGPFRGLLATWNWIRGSFINQFLVVESRGEIVLQGIGLAGSSTIWHILGRALFYVAEAAILFGFLFLLLRRKNSPVRGEYVLIASLNMAILIACLVVPSFANILNMTRFYQIVLIFLAPLFVIGISEFAKVIRKGLKIEAGIALIMIIMIPFLLFQSGAIYEIMRDASSSVPLSKSRMGVDPYLDQAVVEGPDVRGAKWISRYFNSSSSLIYSDIVTLRALNSYGMIYSNTIQRLSNVTNVETHGIVCIGAVDLKYQKIMNSQAVSFNLSGISHILDPLDNVYSNGGYQIFGEP